MKELVDSVYSFAILNSMMIRVNNWFAFYFTTPRASYLRIV